MASSPKAFIYLCMESEEVWEKSLGYAPRSNRELSALLYDKCRKNKI